ncbi:GEVED domain-containing protein [Hymenobacter sp. GOD-10R]|uniref:GEVED domain-containing protein n=1 Tax=Hymenobacter sp. GOD-10R TaxID=3093922 RepID=UPI002D78629A|nr:GEVED domain-containing protein [Hymenobacter sp. GOD-10R]WRQ30253.1 GEVED domain-containing protein [Hymenobacter sp. GOD-10R]
MLSFLRIGRSASAYSFFLLLLAVLPVLSHAQTCPAATSTCTPGSAPSTNFPYGMGIFNVTLGTINNSTSGVTDGYKDYSCTQNTNLTLGTTVPFTVQTNTAVGENVRAWIDLNNDGVFNATSELVYSDLATGKHTGTITVPGTAVVGTRLRLRIAADFFTSPVPTPCSTPDYSQTEDYSVTLSANTLAPAAEFVAAQPLTCSGCVQFTDQSLNAPTSWLWSFGDGTTSTQQNPQHCYTTPGTFTVTLTATNTIGANTRTRSNYISYDNVLPKAASCTPITTDYCCNYGITQFTLGTLTKTSAGGQASYEDFTCSGKVQLTEGQAYPLSITTGTGNPQDTRVWLDLNNDGTFDPTTELIFQALNRSNPTGSYTIPGTAVKNQPLRLRVSSDYVNANFGPCTNLKYGQAEDYTVTILPNTQPPVAAFNSNYVLGGCQNPVQFTDQSQNIPTSWLWSFGDGTTSTQQNPTHTYAASGSYTVSLKATNAYGTNTLQAANYIVLTVPCLSYCPSNGTGTAFWITSVGLTGATLPTPFTSISGADAGGYGNYINRPITLVRNQSYTLTIATNLTNFHTTSVWIDWNQDGTFDISERLADVSTTGTFSGTLTVPNLTSSLIRMRVVARLNTNTPNACLVNQANSETEDYTLIVSTPTATTEASSLPALTVFPNPSTDGILHLHLADAGAAGLYTTTVENVLGARVLSTTLRLTPANDADLDLSALPRGLYLVHLRDRSGHTAVRRVIRD